MGKRNSQPQGVNPDLEMNSIVVDPFVGFESSVLPEDHSIGHLGQGLSSACTCTVLSYPTTTALNIPRPSAISQSICHSTKLATIAATITVPIPTAMRQPIGLPRHDPKGPISVASKKQRTDLIQELILLGDDPYHS